MGGIDGARIQGFGQDIGRRHRVLNGQIDAHTAHRAHGMGGISNAQESRSPPRFQAIDLHREQLDLFPILDLVSTCAIDGQHGSKRGSKYVEAGFPNSDYDFWIGFWAPKGTPQAIVDRLNAETVKALQNPALKAKLAGVGGDPMPMKAAEFDAFVSKEIDVNGSLVKASGVQIN